MFLGITGKYNSSGSKVDGSASSKTRTGKKITFFKTFLVVFIILKKRKTSQFE
jgi:hypothetical protein